MEIYFKIKLYWKLQSIEEQVDYIREFVEEVISSKKLKFAGIAVTTQSKKHEYCALVKYAIRKGADVADLQQLIEDHDEKKRFQSFIVIEEVKK